MRKLMIIAVLVAVVLTMATPAWADGPDGGVYIRCFKRGHR